MTEEEFQAWRRGPVGKWFFEEVLKNEISERDAHIGSGGVLTKDPSETAMRYAEMVGFGNGLSWVIQLNPFGAKNEGKGSR
jgi:hypothetical protein